MGDSDRYKAYKVAMIYNDISHEVWAVIDNETSRVLAEFGLTDDDKANAELFVWALKCPRKA